MVTLFGICMLICFFNSTSDVIFFDLIIQSFNLLKLVCVVTWYSMIYFISLFGSFVSFIYSTYIFKFFDLGFFLNLISFGLFEDFNFNFNFNFGLDSQLYLLICEFFSSLHNFIFSFNEPYSWIFILSFSLVIFFFFCFLFIIYQIIKFIINYIFKK